jgi:glycine hydroxymethyltransferase
MVDFLFRGNLADLDPELSNLADLEAARQFHKLILIPSESNSPAAIRQALSTTFHNIYAEGYPPEYTRFLDESDIIDYKARLAHNRRYADPRYYRGVEYANILEALARRRCAETFAANGLEADDLFVNVQALSGGPANNAVYHALVDIGDKVMGMDLLHGGHLSHGSSVNRSGKYYDIVSYSVDPDTERIDYDSLEDLVIQNKPVMIIAGVSSYPWMLDWSRFRKIADKVGAILFADIAHVAGLIAAKVYDSPVGYADVITFTTHKSLCGPRGAVIITSDPSLSRKIDRAVFPGEQGGPHVNVFAGMALAFKLAQTEKFHQLQSQVIKNCAVFTNRFAERGFKIPYNGTNTHLMNLDTKTIKGAGGAYLGGDLAARILDIAGVVVNRNTIPGDRSALNPTGIRMGTHWITQRGFKKAKTVELADHIADVLEGVQPYYQGSRLRAKVDFRTLEEIKLKVRDLAVQAGNDTKPKVAGYPHFYYLDDEYLGEWTAFEIGGEKVRQYLNFVLSSDVENLDPGQAQPTQLSVLETQIQGTLLCESDHTFLLSVPSKQAGLVAAWLRDLSDGYIQFDDDLLMKIPGPVWVQESTSDPILEGTGDPIGLRKPFYIGNTHGPGDLLPEFQWVDKPVSLQRTQIYDYHLELGAKMVPFAGWEMPVRYGSVLEEHLAVREAAGLFDVSHMGVFQAEGPDALVFLDSVCGNDIGALGVGESLYTHFLNPDANVIDDLLVYRRGVEKYLLVVNASNESKDWAWLNAVREGQVRVDNNRPWSRAYGRKVILRDLKDPSSGAEMRVDLALQGPRSLDILLALGLDLQNRKKILRLKRTQLCEARVGGFDLVVSRTGYTGEKIAFELFVHPDESRKLFQALVETGKPFGLKPIGLGARDSLRIEAGLPLFGHEMGGDLNLGVAEAGFCPYVKVYKPWFVGRDAFITRVGDRKGVVVRFRFNEKGVRMAHQGDPIVDKRGKVIGEVTSCAADSDGLLIGQAFVNLRNAKEGSQIFIFQGASKKADKAPADFKVGDRVTIPAEATILRRFPK